MGRMAKPLTIAVTGASGFIGRAVVACARARGHTVLAIVRRARSEQKEWDEGVTPIVADLLHQDDLGGVLAGADVVVHLAAMMTGDAESQQRNTVDATKALCTAIINQPVIPRLILISSIAVYGHDAVAENGIVDENSPLELNPEKRDIYCRNKLQQEEIAGAFAASNALPLTILRPGAVYGPGKIWNAHIGAVLGPVLVQFTRAGALPVIYVGNCAQAILKACETDVPGPVNLIDPDPPDRARYLKALGWEKPTVVFSWRLLSLIGRLLPWKSKPGLLHPAILRARMMPVGYDTAEMSRLMSEEPILGFDKAMQRSRGEAP
jgi:nucleoside-diphosphate-sugar epimerase